MTLDEAQQCVDAWIRQFKEGYWPPLSNLARLSEEVGEVAREINHLYGAKRKKAAEGQAELAVELADVLVAVMVLANSLDIRLEDAFVRAMAKYETRDKDRFPRMEPGPQKA